LKEYANAQSQRKIEASKMVNSVFHSAFGALGQCGNSSSTLFQKKYALFVIALDCLAQIEEGESKE